jgi:hypothetical protein
VKKLATRQQKKPLPDATEAEAVGSWLENAMTAAEGCNRRFCLK